MQQFIKDFVFNRRIFPNGKLFLIFCIRRINSNKLIMKLNWLVNNFDRWIGR